MSTATYAEVVAYLATVPGALPAWAETYYSMGVPLEAIRAHIATMTADRESPLRESEDGVLSKEIVRMNAAMGNPGNTPGNGRIKVMLRQVLSAGEQARVTRLTGHFCQPVFRQKGKFSKTSHGVMTATRRAVAGYQYSRVPTGARVLEVGPDVNHFVTSEMTDRFVDKEGAYRGASVALGPRDVIRMQWGSLLDRILAGGKGDSREAVVKKALAVRDDGIMINKRVEEVNEPVDGIVSVDANYDLEFMAMPGIMARTHAKWWYGTMCRAKGLTSVTRLKAGTLELSGTTWRVDWAKDRIDFRHPNCNAFGYSHRASNYMRYEEMNGKVWNAPDAHYVYSKGPETSAELLFFSVHRVPYAAAIREPRYVEHPHQRKMRLQSVWAVGDETGGVPHSFDTVVFHVDALNFSKVLEKRRALAHKGDISTTLNLIRSTNVVFFLNGTAVGASTKIEAKLAEATALVVEVINSEERLLSTQAFERAMHEHEVSLGRDPWVIRMLESIVDLRVITGAVVSTIQGTWQALRAPIVRSALAGVAGLKVSAKLEGMHLQLPIDVDGKAPLSRPLADDTCFCEYVATLRMREKDLQGHERISMQLRLREYEARTCVCYTRADEAIAAEAAAEKEEKESVHGSTTDGGTEKEFPSDSATVVSEVTDGEAWQEEPLSKSVETKSMEEVLEILKLQVSCTLSECRIDAQRIWRCGINERVLSEFNTTRTTHAAIEFLGGRSVKQMGALEGKVSAVYSIEKDVIIPVSCRAGVYTGPVPDGWVYTSTNLEVWNHAEISEAVQYALDYGKPTVRRSDYNIILGVPGAGKTYLAAEFLAPLLKSNPNDALYLGVTKAAVESAVKEVVARGVSERVARMRLMTLDSYLCNRKSPAKFLVGDEAPAEHIGRFDAAVALSGAKMVRLYGDGRQVEYSPFVAGYIPTYAAPGATVPEENYKFMPETHRCSFDTCVAWVDKYPAFYPCECHARPGEKQVTLRAHSVSSLADVPFDPESRYHTYKQDHKEEVRSTMPFVGDAKALRAKPVGGLSTVHEDQGSTHKKVVTVRAFADYDKNESAHNPSLFNKDCYVLSDTTRHTEAYDYYSICPERDGVFRAVERAKDPVRRQAVRERRGTKFVRLQELWA